MGFEWDIMEMSVLIFVKLGGFLWGKIVCIVVNSIYVKGDVCIYDIFCDYIYIK